MKKYSLRLILIFLMQCVCMNIYSQTYAYLNGNWLINGKFKKATVYSLNGVFSFSRPAKIDSSIDLSDRFCIPPFGDAHTHNLDGAYGLKEMVDKYIADGVFYVQVLGNHGAGAAAARPVLAKSNNIDVSYANGLLTSTLGHGFYPYEPLAMRIYAPYLQIRYADSIRKSRLVENNAYYFLDSKADVDKKWPLVLRYQPDHIKICLNDAKNYQEKTRISKPDDNGLSEEVAAYIVKKAKESGLRVFAHVETADDARICARIGVSAIAHLPGYYWDGTEGTKEKYCMTSADARLFKKAGMAVIPTFNIDGSTKFDSNGNAIRNPVARAATIAYKKSMLQLLWKSRVPLALGADYYGKTVEPEIDSLISHKVFTNEQLIDIYSRQTPELIFPGKKIGLIKEGYESSFLALEGNPLENAAFIKQIAMRVRKGKVLSK